MMQFSGCSQSIKIFNGESDDMDILLGTFCDGNTPGFYHGGSSIFLDFSEITDSTEIWEFEFTSDVVEGKLRKAIYHILYTA